MSAQIPRLGLCFRYSNLNWKVEDSRVYVSTLVSLSVRRDKKRTRHSNKMSDDNIPQQAQAKKMVWMVSAERCQTSKAPLAPCRLFNHVLFWSSAQNKQVLHVFKKNVLFCKIMNKRVCEREREKKKDDLANHSQISAPLVFFLNFVCYPSWQLSINLQCHFIWLYKVLRLHISPTF